ncbi:hypothetical protein PsYK624_006260 [Phanerochaete sordida]|uniref:Uncharacterized protein n=1 Tax=Phanerochaete sordida TaxID=48140 RepID=A0A9P3L748_9APHY|nr:hypothetical protein PsYK624_006260 [Phanerochaete sordida]
MYVTSPLHKEPTVQISDWETQIVSPCADYYRSVAKEVQATLVSSGRRKALREAAQVQTLSVFSDMTIQVRSFWASQAQSSTDNETDNSQRGVLFL